MALRPRFLRKQKFRQDPAFPRVSPPLIRFDNTHKSMYSAQDFAFIFPVLDIFLAAQDSGVRKKAIFLIMQFLEHSQENVQIFKEIFKLPLISRMVNIGLKKIFLNQTSFRDLLEKRKDIEDTSELQRNVFMNIFGLKNALFEKSSELFQGSKRCNFLSFETGSVLSQDFREVNRIDLSKHKSYDTIEDPLTHIFVFLDKRKQEKIEDEIISTKNFKTRESSIGTSYKRTKVSSRLNSKSPTSLRLKTKKVAGLGTSKVFAKQNDAKKSSKLFSKKTSTALSTKYKLDNGTSSRLSSKSKNSNRIARLVNKTSFIKKPVKKSSLNSKNSK